MKSTIHAINHSQIVPEIAYNRQWCTPNGNIKPTKITQQMSYHFQKPNMSIHLFPVHFKYPTSEGDLFLEANQPKQMAVLKG